MVERERESLETSTFINALFYIWNYDEHRKAGDEVFYMNVIFRRWWLFSAHREMSRILSTEKTLSVSNIRLAMGINSTVANELKMYSGGKINLDT